MLSDAEFDQWCEKLQLNGAARREIQQIRTSEPSRRVAGGKKNVWGRYPSRKMGVTIQFESHKVELPFIYQLEHSEDVLEYYDQPPPFKINCQSASGRNIGFYYTPDFFVIRTDSAGWVECKTEEQLQELAQKNPNRYILGDNHRWYSPPADDHAQPFGFFFRLWSSTEINWTLHRNLEFLEDYYKSDSTSVNREPFNLIISMVSAQPGITLAELFHHAGGFSTDDLYHLIASEEIYVDLTLAPLVEAEQCFVFRDSISAASYRAILHSQTTVNTITSPLVNLTSGTPVSYDGKALTIVLVGENEILLKTSHQETVEFSLDTFEKLLRQGKITNNRGISPDSLSSKAIELFNQASLQDLEKANSRYRALQPYLDGEPIRANTPQERSLRNWLADYRKAQQVYGYGYLGLLSFEGVKGRRQRRLLPYILDKMEKFIENHYETKKQQRKQAVYDAFVYSCSSDGIPDSSIPSYKTFIKEINRRSGYEQTLKRAGSRAAYPLEPFYWELQLTTPRHGDFPFHICHIDHTQSDIELRCSKTGKVLGRAWITLLIDAFSRRILSIYATYDPPSYRSCMMVLRICVKRYGRLPQVIVTDNGKEFHSTYFETLLALFDCTLKHRPAAKSRFSSVCERLFGTANTQFFYNLAGNTQITKKVRLVTKSVNPKNLSLWSLGLLYLYLCEWAYDVYDITEHPALEGLTPREAFTRGINQYGSRHYRRVAYDDNFRILTLPTTDRGNAKVQPGKGIKIEHKYYWSTAFRDTAVVNTKVDIRYDPFDAGIAYAYVHGQWMRCESEYNLLFRGCSEKEIQIASAELKGRQQNYNQNYKIRAKQLGQFLASTEALEILLEQRLRDEQVKEVFRVIEGGLPLIKPYSQPQTVETEIIPSDDPSQTPNEPINPKKLLLFKRY